MTPGDRIRYPMTRICAGSLPSSCLIYPVVTKRRWRCWAISASLRNGATTAGLFRCRHGPLPSRSTSIDDR